MKKKQVEEEPDDEELQEDEGTDPLRQVDKTGPTDISDLAEDEEDVEEDLEDEAPKSLQDKLRTKINTLFKKKSSSKVSEIGDEAAAKKKKKSQLIIVFIALGLIVILFSDQIFPPEDGVGELPEGAPVLKPRPKPLKRPTAEQPVPALEGQPAEGNVETPAVADAPPIVEPVIADQPVEEAPAVEAAPVPGDVTITESSTDDTEINVDLDSINTPDMDIGTDESQDIIDSGMTVESDDNLTDKILQDLEKQVNNNRPNEDKKEYVAPPDYEYQGRGLVYNCTGKHWACVDGPSYKSCEDNASSVKFLKKTTECYPFNVYDTVKGCSSMQNRMVSSSAKTSFCNE